MSTCKVEKYSQLLLFIPDSHLKLKSKPWSQSLIQTNLKETGSGPVWARIINRIPSGLKVFKVPHHGSVNGTFDDQDNPCWLNGISPDTLLAISSHIKPHGHPHQKVIDLFNSSNFTYFRTDTDYHLTFQTEGVEVKTKYSHF